MTVEKLQQAHEIYKLIQKLEDQLEWWTKAQQIAPDMTIKLLDSESNYICNIRLTQDDFELLKQKELDKLRKGLLKLYSEFQNIN